VVVLIKRVITSLMIYSLARELPALGGRFGNSCLTKNRSYISARSKTS
jgi:hypothetical protein